jgi:hypothetical protein
VGIVEIFSLICNAIIFIGGLCLAIDRIAKALGKPINLFKQKTDEAFKEKVIVVLNEVMPGLFLAHDHEVRIKYLADRLKYLEEIKDAVEKDVGDKLNNVDNLANLYKSLEISAKDVLREKIVCMYESNKDTRRLKHFERRALDQYYKDYKVMGGNSYIDILYDRMKTWEVEPDDYE